MDSTKRSFKKRSTDNLLSKKILISVLKHLLVLVLEKVLQVTFLGLLAIFHKGAYIKNNNNLNQLNPMTLMLYWTILGNNSLDLQVTITNKRKTYLKISQIIQFLMLILEFIKVMKKKNRVSLPPKSNIQWKIFFIRPLSIFFLQIIEDMIFAICIIY